MKNSGENEIVLAIIFENVEMHFFDISISCYESYYFQEHESIIQTLNKLHESDVKENQKLSGELRVYNQRLQDAERSGPLMFPNHTLICM